MKRINIVNFSKTLVFFSLVVLFSGVAFDFDSNKKLLNPKNDTYLVSPNKDKNGTVSITTIDKNDINGGKPVNDNNNSNSSSNANNVPNDSNSVNQNTQSKVTPSVDIINNNLRSDIQNKYGINVKYASDTDGYTVSNLKVISLTNSNDINVALNKLNSDLLLYPINLFGEIRGGGYNLTIYLVKKYSVNNVTGITDTNGKKVIISLATEYQFSESLHHELYHYMENYMYTKGARYSTWNNLNPSGFKYGKHNSNLSYSYTRDSNSYFVNNYAQTADEEDRASTFEYMMASSKSSCLEKGKPIWLKAKYMCEQIDAVFSSVSPNSQEFWERYVY